ncbi:PSMD4 ATPase, partial [Poecile atricapillus]|nr:PSMD4 ATPase [Poecile atricapillus]
NCEVLTTLTPDTGRILSKLHSVQPKGKITFGTGIRVAHLALKHRQGKNHKMRIIAFVGSPVLDSDKDLVKLAKRLKKEKVNVDIINFGEEVRIPGIPTFQGEFPHSQIPFFLSQHSQIPFFPLPTFPNPVSLSPNIPKSRFSLSQHSQIPFFLSQHSQIPFFLSQHSQIPFFSLSQHSQIPSMSEEEQIAYAMQMSLQGAEFAQAEAAEVDSGAAMDTSEPAKEEDDYDVMQDPEFLQSVLENLPGVDPNNEAIRNAMGSLASQAAR